VIGQLTPMARDKDIGSMPKSTPDPYADNMMPQSDTDKFAGVD